MNVFKIDRKTYKYESFWRSSYNDTTLDSVGNRLPWPGPWPDHRSGPRSESGSEHIVDNEWQQKKLFLCKLYSVQQNLNKNIIKYNKDQYKSCLICHKKNISTGLYSVNGIRWENGLYHYIDEHNIKPSEQFIDSVFKYENKPKLPKSRKLYRLHGETIVKNNKKYLKLERNQIMIMDALMEHGGKKQYIDERKKTIYRYSEHAGLLDFDNNGLEKIIIYGNTFRVESNDEDIYLPESMADAFDYEYIFHTHPPTPKPGGRAHLGVVYEFPSVSDIFHFLDHYNEGETQGSIVIAPEGMYIIRKLVRDDKKININEDKFFRIISKHYAKVQHEAHLKHGHKFSTERFYSVIAQDKSFINKLNIVLNKFSIHIDYYSRIKDSEGRWIIESVYLPVYVVEKV